jgi:Ohr subfamily peroxiredoxin
LYAFLAAVFLTGADRLGPFAGDPATGRSRPPSKKEHVMSHIEKVLYTAKAHTTGGRDGASRSSDGRLDVKLSSPGGPGGGTNPEQLFAAGWSACFMSAIALVASQRKIHLPSDRAIDAEIDLGTNDGGYLLQARLNVNLPGLEREVVQGLVDAAHQVCPYSKATRSNIDVVINVV